MGCWQLINMNISASKFFNSLKRVVGTNLKVGTFLGLFAAAISTMVLLVCFKDSLISIEERVGALPWTLFSDKTLEERIG